jgi:ubiquinone/menaquinone biosynthesis C-methylase UbiE
MDQSAIILDWHERSYAADGINAQRRYPNEELIRFLSRNFFKLAREERARISILDAGCGSCSNLWMIAREGFDAHGVDLSPQALRLGRQTLMEWGVHAQLKAGNLLSLPYDDRSFDAVVDVVASYLLNLAEFNRYLTEVARVLKTSGRFFLFTPSTESDAFKNYAPAEKIDEFTLNGVHRKDSPYYGNFLPFRFSDAASLQQMLRETALEPLGLELITRTYGRMTEKFQFISLEARREQ